MALQETVEAAVQAAPKTTKAVYHLTTQNVTNTVFWQNYRNSIPELKKIDIVDDSISLDLSLKCSYCETVLLQLFL